MRVSGTPRFPILAAAFIAATLAIPARAIPAEAAGSMRTAEAAAATQVNQWTFRVIADPAVVRAGPDPTAPAVDSFAKGGQVKSFAAEGAWIRFLITRPDGSVIVGYVAATDLELLETKEEAAADYWKVEEDSYFGRGIVVRLSGGYGTFGGGDLRSGSQNLFQIKVDQLLAQGYEFETEDPMEFGSRTSFEAEFLYHLSSRFALGVGVGAAWSRDTGEYTYASSDQGNQLVNYGAQAVPRLRTYSYRAILSYLLPINKRLALRLSGGPMLVQAKFFYLGLTPIGTQGQETFNQTAASTGLGAHASLALELNLNEQASFFLEVGGRAGRLSGFEGTQDTNTVIIPPAAQDVEVSGTLYAVEIGGRRFSWCSPIRPKFPGLVMRPSTISSASTSASASRSGFKTMRP